MKILYIGVLSFLCMGFCDSFPQLSACLVPPLTTEGAPQAGKRVRVYLKAYPKAYYVLFLPYNFTNKGRKKWPVIIESPGNEYEGLQGLPDDIFLGFGLTRGLNYIWVSVPFIDEEGQVLSMYWGKNPLSTVQLWQEVLEDLSRRFTIDHKKMVLAGFSRGAVSTSYIGNYTDAIRTKWVAYFACAHFDGCCQTLLGSAEERIARIQGRKVCICVGTNDSAKTCSIHAYERLMRQGCPATYIEIPGVDHRPDWILGESESAEKAREWLEAVCRDE